MARVKDTFFTHQNSNKRLRRPLRDLKLQPLSKSEEREALANLKKIVPNALIFSKDESDTDTASENEEDEEGLMPTQHQPHTKPRKEREKKLPEDEKHLSGDEKNQLTPPVDQHPWPFSGKTSDNDGDNSNSDTILPATSAVIIKNC